MMVSPSFALRYYKRHPSIRAAVTDTVRSLIVSCTILTTVTCDSEIVSCVYFMKGQGSLYTVIIKQTLLFPETICTISLNLYLHH